jgi:hypothetical protein
MDRLTMFFRTLAIALAAAAAFALASMLGFVHVAADDGGQPIFKPFEQIDGVEQAQPIDEELGDFSLNSRNKFFDPGLGTNGQACVTCHQPADGYDIHVSSIQNAFAATVGTGQLDPLFRCNDTADNPFTCPSGNPATDYNLFLNLGVIRFARPVHSTDDFAVALAPKTLPK